MNKLKYLAIGMLIGAFALPFQWIGEPVQLAIGQTVTVDSTQSPIVVNAMADLADLTPSDGQSVIIKTGAEKGLWYYDKDSAAVVDSVAVLTGPGSVGRFLVISNDIGSIAAATAITVANYHTLPTAVAGLTYTFVVQDADGLRIVANTADTIRLGPNVTATAGYIESTTIGDVVTVTAINATEWVGHAYGTWTNGTWSYALADTP